VGRLGFFHDLVASIAVKSRPLAVLYYFTGMRFALEVVCLVSEIALTGIFISLQTIFAGVLLTVQNVFQEEIPWLWSANK